ncbi:MAG: hypothetical protein KAW12_04160 [Candidatus Aminicenantes bacterium]|nr:hypothetical protein [Candidatus Aminicenantes bacterium]
MKKIISFMIVLCFVLGTSIPQVASDDVKKAHMSHFMKVKWGVNLKDFDKVLKQRTGLKTKSYISTKMKEHEGTSLITTEILKNHMVIDFNVDVIFCFRCPIETIEELKIKNKGYSEWLKVELANPKIFLFHSVLIETEPEHFNDLYAIFKVKYGSPTMAKESKITNRMGAEFTQIEAIWINDRINRQLVMKRYGDKIDKSYISFSPYDKDYMAKRMKYIKEAAAMF